MIGEITWLDELFQRDSNGSIKWNVSHLVRCDILAPTWNINHLLRDGEKQNRLKASSNPFLET